MCACTGIRGHLGKGADCGPNDQVGLVVDGLPAGLRCDHPDGRRADPNAAFEWWGLAKRDRMQ